MTSKSIKLSSTEMHRLTLVRHLYNGAVIQSREADVRSGLALLPFHDAAEIFLQLACEKHEAAGQNKKPDFAEYWNWLSQRGVQLMHLTSMKRLNSARVEIKHRGALPASIEVEGLRAVVTNFFQDNTPIAFGIPFDKISLITLIEDSEVVDYLSQAEGALGKADYQDCLTNITCAFVLSLRKYETNARSLANRQHYRTVRSSSASALSLFAGVHGLESDNPNVNRAIGEISDAIIQNGRTLSEAITVIGYGLDFHAYQLFKAHAPIVHEMAGGPLHVQWMKPATDDSETAQQCLNFVIDTAVRLKI